MAAEAQLTPMMTQYRRIKGELPKAALLLFRPGDFYEMFFEDAQTGAQILNSAPQPSAFARSVARTKAATSSELRMAGQFNFRVSDFKFWL